jgi:hypothetical protein
MTSRPYSETSQPLDGFGVTYEELLLYGQHHLTGKRVRSPDKLSFSGLLNLHGSCCSERLCYFSMVRHRPLPFNPRLFPKDYIVTFEDELNFVWRVAPRFSMAKLIFFVVGHVTVEWWTILMHVAESLLIHN